MFMLDTDICSHVLKTKPQQIRERFERESENIAISAIVLAELRFGAERHPSRTAQISRLIDDFVSRLHVLPWEASSVYGKLRTHLERKGTLIGNLDTLIAAHALHAQAVLVTNNTRHFSLVPDLTIDSWI